MVLGKSQPAPEFKTALLALQDKALILQLDLTDRTATCQPGVVTEQLQNRAEEHGLYYPVDFASAGIGADIAANQGYSLRHDP